jgi:glyoxylate/hydroxypyruvate reductase A
MPSPIAFVSRMNAETEAVWKQALRAAMPQEEILSFSELTDEQRRAVDFAIVANPDPADIAGLPGLKWIHSLWAGVERLVLELGDKAPPIVRLKDPELSRVMAEAVLAWAYYLQRDMPAYRENQQKALWQELDYRHPRRDGRRSPRPRGTRHSCGRAPHPCRVQRCRLEPFGQGDKGCGNADRR